MRRSPEPVDGATFATIAHALHERGGRQATGWAYTFLADGEGVEQRITYGELDARARGIARRLLVEGARGERVLLLYPPGLDYIAAFYGCLYAGAVAVPAYPPDPARLARSLPRLQAIVGDSGARVILTTSPILAMTPMLLKQTPELAVPAWIASDQVVPLAPDGDDRLPAADDLAFLQYTSGSTTAPKGAMVSHRNIIANQRMIARGFGSDEHDVGVGWLPFYHDMGLIGNVLHPMYVGYPFVLMSPIAFLQKPVRWLRAITRYRARVSGGPNFAYELCARRIGGADLDGLELSSWLCAFNGAEPIRPATIERFAAVFAPCGFRREAFYPCYGLAEATLIATGGRRGGGVVVRAAGGGERGRAALVGCGQPLLDERVVVVDPQRATRCGDGVEGEIWIAGDNVAAGYWRQPEATAHTFGAVLAGGGDERYLRTGDLGMMVDGELFVAGRMKDLIIVRGRNLYPQDVEATVEAAHAAVRSGAVAAFAFVGEDGEEEVGIAAEVVIGDDELVAVREAITAAAVLGHDVAPALIVLLDRGRLPKTSSGKLQRRATGAAAAAGELAARSSWRAPRRPVVVVEAAAVAAPVDRLDALAPERRVAAVRDFLVAWLAGRSGAAAVDPRAAFASQGVDSRDAVELAAALEGWLGRPVAATVAYDHPSIDQVAAWAAGEVAVVAPPAPARGPDQPIAIIGLGCRVPGADDPAAFWRLLRDGVDTVAEVPAARLDLAPLFAEQPARGHTYVRRAALFDDVDQFDAAFFAISPREAASLDPQQRLLLEVAWSAIEDSGRSPRALSGTRTGVFVGIATNDYAAHHLRSGDPDRIDVYAGTGTAFSTAAGRISYVLGATGPSMAIDTACSSSLTAVHLACQSLRTGESDLALAGGVNVILAGESFVYLSQLGALAPDGRCKTFDRRADGYGRGEGCAVVVLKRLVDALRDGDPIHAVVRGSAVNQDGASNGLTAPSGPAQTAVIRAALERAGVTADQVDYVEAHGTGTPLGDPIELNALGAALSSPSRPAPLWVGSVKTNIGHTEAAAGVLGLCKTVLALGHEELTAHLHLQEPTPHVAWRALGLAVPAAPTPWPRGARPRFAGVSSFGLSGTNVHLVVEEAPAVAATVRVDRPAHLLTWSAATPAALIAQGARLAGWLEDGDAAVAEAGAALAHGRTAQRYRAAVVGGSAAALAGAIRARAAAPAPVIDRALRIGFLFTGQGAQVVGMGGELARTVPSFRRALDRCAAVLDRLLPVPLDRLLAADLDARALAETGLAQPALFAVEYALAETWRSWGVAPVAVLGHSLGELVAACVAGVLSVEDAGVLVAHRGRLMQGCVRGAMAAITAGAAVVVDVVDRHRGGGTLAIASINGPDQLVIAGDADRVDAACAELTAAGVSARRLDVSHAFHSAHMAPASVELGRIAATLAHAPARVPVVSTRWGRAATATELDASYWPAQMMAPVKFADAIGAMIDLGVDALIELGPQPILLGTHRRIDPASPVLSLASLDRNRADLARMLGSLAALIERGHTPPWDEVVGPRPARPLGLPTYAFQRERHWIDAPGAVARAPRPDRLAPVAAAGTVPPLPHGRDGVVARLQIIVGDLLGLAPARVEVDVPLADLGADSIILVEGLQRVQQELGVRIGLRDALSTLGTITALADHIAAALTRRLAVGTADHVAIRAAYHLAVGTAKVAVIADVDALQPALPPSALDARRSAHVAALVERYAARSRGSKARKAASHAGLADVRAAAGFRSELSAAQREAWLATKELGYPIVGARSQGARIWDLDDNAYVDLAMGFGVHLFGHNPPFVIEALQQQLGRGIQLGPLADGAAEVAALVRELTGVERVALCGSGSEAVMTALRLARARVDRPLVVAFAGSYHGAADGVLPVIPFTRGCGPGVERDLLVLEYGNPQSLAIIAARAHELAAVLVEPVQGRRPELQPREFLHELRAITARHGVALIFDEVLVGFRIGPGGAQAHFGVEADLVTYGKIVGGGMPIGVVAGRAEFLDGIDGGAWSYGDRSLPTIDTIWFAGTFNKNPLSMAAAVATLRQLRDQGPALQLALNRRTAALVDTLNGEFARAAAPIEAVHFGSLLRLHLPRSLELLYHHLIDRGVYVWEGRSMFLSTAHGDAEVAHVVAAVRSALAELGEGGFLDQPAARAEAVLAPVPVIGPRPARLRPARAAAARLRLCCLPYAGGGSSTYLSWGPILDSRITIHPVELAGRDGRASEPPHTDYGRLIDALVAELRPTLARDTGPCVLFGHSMGALLAYGVARRLIADGLNPALLVVSGEPAPHLTQRPLVPTHELDDTALIELMLRHGAPIELRDRELSAGALRLLRADLAVCESFVAGEPEPLAVPIVAFAGDADPLAAVAAVAGWERHTRARFAMHTLEGDHFFIRRSRDRLLALLQRELAPGLVDATAAEVMAPLVTAEAP